ncbi:hypothetical protein IP92_04482 [Pseudoduganella flava]|uniref:DUF2875 domain-containing protein n=1 Tax=Pseudoduganella flava TaxID=871742 RepID=A0A562PHQ7_9BURK|nr:hypothetical protein [Pseudoduganella flava]QGZ37673.1 hypothetical protein GO485_00440 [Pseudoduganella flava]TWI43964.1 hypothetical protein IP92_04482 [Pseudoduganella flava]
MLSWFRTLIAAGASFGAAWAGAVWYWRANNVAPGSGDLALYLLVVPTVLLLSALGIAKLRERMNAAPATPSANAAATPAAAAQAADVAAVAPLAIVAAAVHVPHGASVHAWRDALAEGNARPALDDELIDDYGYPVMAARIADLDDEPVREAVTAWLAGRTVPFDDAQWRALAAGQAVATELAAPLADHPALAQHAARVDTREPSPLPQLQLHFALPADWTPPQRDAAAGWFAHVVAHTAGWPAERIAAAVTDDAAATLARLFPADGQGVLAALLACGSQLDTATVDHLAAGGKLFTARQQQGRIPGEGAAALLVADAAQGALLGAADNGLGVLRAVASGQREQDADTARRTDAQALQAACTQALERAHVTPDQVAFIAADTDHRTGRVMELMAVLPERMPQLDATTDIVSAGSACGACAPVPFVAALALAAVEAHERAAPVLCVGNLDPYRRDVAVIAPPAAA